MSDDQTPDNRTPNGASDLLDDGAADNVATDPESQSTPAPDALTSAEDVPSVAADEAAAISEENEEFLDAQQDEEDEDSALLEERPSLATVSAIVDSIVKQKQSHPEDASDVSELASKEIDKYYHHEAHKKETTENAAIVAREGKHHSFTMDDIHGEGTAETPEKAPYQDEKYGEQPPISLWGETNSNPNPSPPPANPFVWGGELAGHISKPCPPGENVSNIHPLLERSSGSGRSINSHPTVGELSEKPSPPGENASHPLLERSKQELIAARRRREDAEDESDDEEMDEVALELGMTPESHPEYFRRKRYKVPILHNRYCQYCMIVSGLVILSLSVAALVTKGFETVKRHHDHLHPKHLENGTVSSSNAEKEKLDWWLSSGSMSEKEFESLAYTMEDSYLPIWFDRKTGWEGQTYQEAVEFCKKHDDFVPCPYDVYCPGNAGKLIEGIMDEGVSWAPIRDETNGWVQIGAGAKECDVFLGGNENAAYRNWNEDETNTRHVMCCLETPLSDDIDGGDGGEAIDTTFSPNLDLPDAPKENHGDNPQLNVDQWYLQEIIKKYNPRWFDRESTFQWKGQTYQDAVSFCYASKKGVPCPYSVYCPKGPTGNVIFDMAFDEGEQWAATGDRNNQFVQVGKEDQCNRVTASSPAGYGRSNGDIDVMKHVMCCNDVVIEITTEGGEQSSAEKAPLATDETAAESTATGNQSSGSTTSATPHHLTLTELEHAVKNHYIPFWFGFKDGWSGGTYDDAVDFCANLDPGRGDNFHLCPMKVYCPNGPYTDKPLFLQREAFEGEQWAPTTLAHNAWIQIGQIDPENPRTCTMYNDINSKYPDWGLDGSEPGLKQHIMCCKGGVSDGYDWQNDAAFSTAGNTAYQSTAPESEFETAKHETAKQPDEYQPSVSTESDATNESETSAESAAAAFESSINIDESTDSSTEGAQGSIQGMPSNVTSSGSGSTHAGAGNSSPHAGTTTQEEGVVVHLQPVWYDHSHGWNGGSHQDAEDFCESKGGDHPMTLCPYMAYCPQGPSALALGGLDMSFSTEEQYAPYQGEDDHWVLIGRFNNARTTTCLDYTQLFGEVPSWATDDSRKELKQHVLCCKSDEAGISSVAAADVPPSTAAPITTEAQGQPLVDTSEGVWYGISGGWKGGSHTDAIKFCNNEVDDDGVPLQLCPYEAYCPSGPSKPTVPNTNAYIGINEEMEQWSPTLSKGNHWVMVGSRNGNDSTTCLDTWQLDGDENPSWGLDESNSNQKHHVMCCPLAR